METKEGRMSSRRGDYIALASRATQPKMLVRNCVCILHDVHFYPDPTTPAKRCTRIQKVCLL